MQLESFSIVELEKRLKAVESVEEKIKLIAYEILQCKRAIREIEHQVKNIDPTNVKLTAKVNCNDPSILDILNSDRELRNTATRQILFICSSKICEQYNEFLKEAQELYDYYKTELDLKVSRNNTSANENVNQKTTKSKRIIWLVGKEKLLKLFVEIKGKYISTEFKDEEFLSHFADEKHFPLAKGIKIRKMIRWCKSDSSFSVFVDELAKRNAIDDNCKYKIFEKHFLNRNGEPFQYLAQKKNHTINFTRTAKVISHILDSAKITIIIFFSLY